MAKKAKLSPKDTTLAPHEEASIRVDKWLWFARVAKSRSLAQKLVTDGHVRLNSNRLAAAHRKVRAGDVLTIARADNVLVYKVVQLGERRGPACEARELFEDLSPPPLPKRSAPDKFSAPKPQARPSRDDRRALAKLKKKF